MDQKIIYGGQAVIEGVMIRGMHIVSVAVRNPKGTISTHTVPINSWFNSFIRKIPFVRGILVMAETLAIGMRALTYSANVAAGEDEEFGKGSIAVMMILSLAFAIGFFFLLPVFASKGFESLVDSNLLANIVEGLIRLILFLLYVIVIGRTEDIRRVFMYHGAEHMAVHAYENGEKLTTESVSKYPTAHPRCGTAFLLVVMLVAIIVFAFIPRDPLWWLITSRIILIPAIAAASYEAIRLSGIYSTNPLLKLISVPGLVLQRLTTREPDPDQIEVAIVAMQEAISHDEMQVSARQNSS
ncbi:MAG: hypothetical protein CL883_00765 [Dehalococcoidia bacterium]|nr:hypothetical protein [Dehalococcoidia bacterium]|tara:strand:- start:845 stop:1738 length:894 start_codon:yes stop_codon:yes gene_type:complete